MIIYIKIDGRDKPKMKILVQNRDFVGRILLGGRTCLGGLPSKFRKPYWNPVKKAGHIRCPKPDTPI
jgi:hypothetical protein